MVTVSFHVFTNQWFRFSVPVIFNRNNAKIRKRKKSVRWEETENGCSKNENIKECWKRLKTSLDEKAPWRIISPINYFLSYKNIYLFHPTHLLGNQEHSKRPASWPKTFFANLPFREWGSLLAGCALPHNMAVIQPFFLHSKRNLYIKFQFLA